MKTIDRVFHPRIPFEAKDFDEQEGFRFTLEVEDNRSIETGVYLHWAENKPFDIAIDLSCMSGCTQNCTFCSAANALPITLQPMQICDQAEIALEQVKHVESSLIKKIQEEGKITFSFQGMGEPCDMPGIISEAIGLLENRFSNDYSKTQYSVSTVLSEPSALVKWKDLTPPLHTLQFSLHSPNDKKRRGFIPRCNIKLQTIFDALKGFHNESPDTQIKINYVLIAGENDTDQDRDDLLRWLKGTDYFLKISFLNLTNPAITKGYLPPSNASFNDFFKYCRQEYSKTYKFGSFKQIEISCGQLASYAAIETVEQSTQDEICRLYEEIKTGRCTLFLGAGASYTAWDQDGLAKTLYNELRLKKSFRDSRMTLSEVADIFEHRRNRNRVNELINNTLERAQIPRPMIAMCRYPWRSIYTTNYDQFVERAYELAMKYGFANKSCHPITSLKDLHDIPENAIPLIKIHGCISKGVRQIISETDYLDGYIENVDFFLSRFQIDRLEGSALFIGYSFRDNYIQHELFRLGRRLTRSHGNMWAVQPLKETTGDDRRRLSDKYKVILIPITFQGLLDQLEILRRKPVIFISGSVRDFIASDDAKIPRKDVSERIQQFCQHFSRGLQDKDIRVVTGATATDKVGYLIGRMLPRELVTTYVWHGADQVPGNQISDMINVSPIGRRPADVIDRLLAESNMLVVIGGGGLTLREAQTAISLEKPVIPIAVGENYASDVIHSFFMNNQDSMGLLSQDLGPDASFAENLTRIMHGSRLKYLDLKNDPKDVAEVALEAIEHITTAVLGQIVTIYDE